MLDGENRHHSQGELAECEAQAGSNRKCQVQPEIATLEGDRKTAKKELVSKDNDLSFYGKQDELKFIQGQDTWQAI